jgi:hypothetical protein
MDFKYIKEVEDVFSTISESVAFYVNTKVGMLRWRAQARKFILLHRNATIALQKHNCALCTLNF